MNLSQVIILLLSIKGIGKKTVIHLCSKINVDEIDRSFLYSLITRETKIEIDYDIFIEKVAESSIIISECKKNEIGIMNYQEDCFPKKLLSLADYPVILYYKGKIERLNSRPSIAIVGTREPSDYGKEIAKRYARFIAEDDINVISGLAKGIDGIAQKSTVESGGYTVAFLAQGLNTEIYPMEHRELAERIILSGGALISEYSPNSRPFKSSFVERDRLQSGSSDSVLVIETDVKGGTMHAAKSIVDLNRILGVFKHPKKYSVNNKKSEGNKILISEYGGVPIYSKDEMSGFVQSAIEHSDMYFKNSDDIETKKSKDSVEQISLDI